MKTVEEMTNEEFRAEVQRELLPGGSVREDVEFASKTVEGNVMATLLALLAKERVWRKDIDARLKKLETAASPYSVPVL